MASTRAAEHDQTVRPYGLWPSPITPRSLSQGLRLGDVAWDSDGRSLVWLEGRSDRGVLVTAQLDRPAPRDLTSDLSVRAFVGYGGGDFTAGHGQAYFVSDGRLYRVALAGGSPRALTPPFGQAASPALSPDGRWLVYVHSDEQTDCLAIVDSEGSSWPQKLAEGRDFFMQPRWHPSGDRIAWIAWDHPNMPWDGTELTLARVDSTGALPRIVEQQRLAGGPQTAIFQPEFSPDGRSIAYISDETGWGQLYLRDLESGAVRRLTSDEIEHGRPAWVQGLRTYSFAGSGRIAIAGAERGKDRLQIVDLAGGEATGLPAEISRYTDIGNPTAAPSGSSLAAVVSAADIPPRVVTFDLDAGGERVWAHSSGESVPRSELARPEQITWPSIEGEAQGLFYAPPGGRFESPGLPPLIVIVHGGPTSQMTASYHAQTQFLTTRGYAVLEVNYRGSTGYGREYMLRLRESWGIYDVEDSIAGARALAERGRVDARRRVIMGGSAGGFTVLQALVSHPGFFTAGVCLYGVSNQFTLATDTHKFEQHYLDSLLGPLPQAAALYRERSPIFHADRIIDPIAVFQGDIDRVVPRAQSDEIVASLKARNVPHEYHVYAGEGHGWRKSETIEAFYTALDRFLKQYVVFA
jgi:dipeptidyl aminopeptidase/acylaminoacyl peptidase